MTATEEPRSVVVPLHKYTSPNGNGLCSYRFGVGSCGQTKTSYVHLSEKPITEATLEPLVPGRGLPDGRLGHPFTPAGDGRDECLFSMPDGDWCGAAFALHAIGTPPVVPSQRKPIDPVRAYLDAKADAAYTTFHGATFPVDSPPTMAQGLATFFDEALRLAIDKNDHYGDAWRAQGWMGNLARVQSKVARLKNMLWRDELVGEQPETMAAQFAEDHAADMFEETVRDTLLDLANLCGMMAANMGEGNKWGR